MQIHTTLRLGLSSFLICVLSASAQAKGPDETEKAFNEQFGKEAREIRRTRVTNDDAEFAQRLLSEAQSGKHTPELTTRLYEKAYESGLRDLRGYPTASEALDKLFEEDPARKLDLGEMRLVLWEKWHQDDPDAREVDPDAFVDLCMQFSRDAVEAGDIDRGLKFLSRGNRFASRNESARTHDVRDAITELNRHRKILGEIAELEEAVATDPAAIDKLAMLYLTHLDDPAKAATYADQMTDQVLAGQIRLAANTFKHATPAQANQTGTFYLGLVNEGSTRKPVAMLIRARVWLTEYLSRETSEPQTIQAAHAMLGEIDAALLKRGIGKKLRRKMSGTVRGEEGQFDRPADVQAAIDKGVQWLYTQQKDKTHWEQTATSHHNYGGYTALTVYALLMADEEPQVNGDLSRAVHFMMNTEMRGIYPICFRIHAWEVLPKRERYRQTLIQDVNRLRRGATQYGFWGYNITGKDVVPGERIDLSTTLAGGLGLWIGEEVGGVTPKKVYWERTARALIDHQLDDNGWSYNPATQKTSQGAMTSGALTLLYASYPHLGNATKAKVDEAIEKGMQWMDQNFSPTNNVNRRRFKNYYFAAVQHAGLFAGRREFREMDWYASITEHLLKAQDQNGSWGDVSETAFAIAFLCRGGVVYEPSASDLDLPQTDGDISAKPQTDAPAQAAEVTPAKPLAK